MDRGELTRAVAQATRRSVRSVDPVVRGVFAAIAAELRAGVEVQIQGFGRFAMAERAARSGQHFHTGQRVPVPAMHVPKFSPSARMLDPPRKRAHAYDWRTRASDHAATLQPAPSAG